MSKTRTSIRRVLSTGVAGMLMVASVPAGAAPVLSNTAAVRSAVIDHAVDVRWRGRGPGWGGVAAGFALGAIAGAAIAGSYRYGPGYGYYGYSAPYYSPSAGYYAPAYGPAYAPGDYGSGAYAVPSVPGPYGRCFVQTDDRGYGYWRAC